MSIRQGQTIIASTGYVSTGGSTNNNLISSGWNLFDTKFSDHVLDDPSWVKSDDNNWIDGNVYTDAYTWLENEWTKEYVPQTETTTETLYGWKKSSDNIIVYSYESSPISGMVIYTYDETTTLLQKSSLVYEDLRYGGYESQGAVELTITKVSQEWITDDWNITYRNVGIKLCAPSECDRIDYRYGPSAQGDGIAWYYVIDTENKRFKLPRTKYNFVGTRGNVGEVVLDGTDGFYVSATEMYLYFFLGETIKDGRIIDINGLLETTTQLQNNTYTKAEVDNMLGDVSSILDAIIGEEI